jgi:hypothetical protein
MIQTTKITSEMVNDKSSLAYVKYSNHVNNNQLGFQVNALIALSKTTGPNKEQEIDEVVDDIIRYHSVRNASTWNTPEQKAKFTSSSDTTFYRSQKLAMLYKNELKDHPELIARLEDKAIRKTLDSIKGIDGYQRVSNTQTENSISMLNEVLPFLEKNKDAYKEYYDQAKVLKEKPNLKPFFDKAGPKELAIKELLAMRQLTESLTNLDRQFSSRDRTHHSAFVKSNVDKNYYKEAIPLIEEMIRRTDNMKYGTREEFDKGSFAYTEQMKGVMDNYKRNKAEILKLSEFSNDDIKEIKNRVKFLREDSNSYFINGATITTMTGTNRELTSESKADAPANDGFFKKMGDSLRNAFAKKEAPVAVAPAVVIADTTNEPSKSVFQQLSEKIKGLVAKKPNIENIENSVTQVVEQKVVTPAVKKVETVQDTTNNTAPKKAIEATVDPTNSQKATKTEAPKSNDIYQELVAIKTVMELHGGRVDELKNRGDLAKFEGHMQQIKSWATTLSQLDNKDIILEKSMDKANEMVREYRNLVQTNKDERTLIDQGLAAMQYATRPGKLESHKDLKERYEQVGKMNEILAKFPEGHQCVEHQSQDELNKIRQYVERNNDLTKCYTIAQMSKQLAQKDLDDPFLRSNLVDMYKANGTNNPIHKMMKESYDALMDYKAINPHLKTPEMVEMAQKMKTDLLKFRDMHQELKAGTLSTSLDVQFNDLSSLKRDTRKIETPEIKKQVLSL